MNPKIEKLTTDIEKLREKISASQSRLAELEQQKTDLENTEIIVLFRSLDTRPSELAGFIRAFREQAPAQRGELPAPAQPSTPYAAQAAAPYQPKEAADDEE